MNVIEALEKRISANKFDNKASLTHEQITELVTLASHAPSSYNAQNARFVAVTTPEAKEALKGAAYGQQKIADAAVAFVVLGDLQAHLYAKELWSPFMSGEALDGIVATISGVYANETAGKMEAFRSAGLYGMALMLAAEEKGYVSCPMGGFDAEAVKKALNISDRYHPSMIIVVGPSAEGNYPRKPRLSVDKVLSFESGANLA